MSAEEDFKEFMRKLESEKDVGPEARRAAAGMPPGPREISDEEAGTMSLPRTTTVRQYGPITNTPGESYQSARAAMGPAEQQQQDEEFKNAAFMAGMIPAAAGGALAGRAAGGIVGTAAPRLAPIAEGEIGGGVANKAMGGNFVPGMVLGAGFGAAGAVGDAAAGAAGKRFYRELGRGAGEEAQTTLRRLGPEQIIKTSRDYGVMDAVGAEAKAAAASAAKQKVGQQIGQAYAPLDAAGVGRPTAEVVRALENLKGEMSKSTTTAKLTKLITEKQLELQKLYPQTIPASALNREIGDLEGLGYSGKSAGQLSAAAAKKVPRDMANAMETELQTALTAAKKNPQLAPHVDAVDQLNPTYRSTLVLNKILDRKAVKDQFALTTAERFAAEPMKTTLRGALNVGRNISDAALGAMSGAEGAAVPSATAAAPERRVSPAVVPIVQSLQNGGADLHQHVEAAVFGQ